MAKKKMNWTFDLLRKTDIKTLNALEASRALTKLGSATNRNIKNLMELQKQGVSSPSLEYIFGESKGTPDKNGIVRNEIKRGFGMINTKIAYDDKKLNEIKSELTRMKHFLNLETTNVSKTKKYYNKQRNNIKKSVAKEIERANMTGVLVNKEIDQKFKNLNEDLEKRQNNTIENFIDSLKKSGNDTYNSYYDALESNIVDSIDKWSEKEVKDFYKSFRKFLEASQPFDSEQTKVLTAYVFDKNDKDVDKTTESSEIENLKTLSDNIDKLSVKRTKALDPLNLSDTTELTGKVKFDDLYDI